MFKLGWFSTGRGEGSRGLLLKALEAVDSGYVPARIAFVFCNREPGEHEGSDRYQALVKSRDIPLLCLSSRAFKEKLGPVPDWRVKYDREVMRLIEHNQFDLGVLAGYMLIVGPEMCRSYPLINLHPAAPGGPKGTWQEVIWLLIKQRAPQAGVKIHLATEELDEGPTVTYCTYSVQGEEFRPLWKAIEGRNVDVLKANAGEDLLLFKRIREHGVAREQPLIIETLKELAEGKLRIRNGAVVDGQGRSVTACDLTEQIEAALKRS
ncbi:MAG: phosphoglycerate transporter [Chloroflexi bacterium]|nr:phosphoglycerate transporter [Chloroflexota bacterium]